MRAVSTIDSPEHEAALALPVTHTDHQLALDAVEEERREQQERSDAMRAEGIDLTTTSDTEPETSSAPEPKAPEGP